MKERRQAFTIVELIVVIATIGILATMALLSFSHFQIQGRDAQRAANVNSLAESLEKYYDKNGEYPSCSALATDATTVSKTVLTNIDTGAFVAPQAPTGETNSLKCTDLTGAPSEADYYAYVGDGSAGCTSGFACLQFTLKYREESTGAIISIDSRRRTQIATSGAPTLSVNSTGSSSVNITWTAVANASSYTVQYATNNTFSAGLRTMSTTTTSQPVAGLTSGMTYYFRVQAVASSSVGNWSNIVALTLNFMTLTWTEQTGSGARNWYGATISDDGTKLAATSFNGYIYTSTNSGTTWTERTSSGLRYWYFIDSSSDGTKLIATTSGDYIHTSTNSGATWTAQTALGASGWTGAALSADGTKIAVAGSSLSVSSNSGATWTDRSPNTGGGWYRVVSSQNGTILMTKQNNTLYISTNSGVDWTARGAFSGGGYAMSNDGTKLVAGDYGGYLSTSTDSGATWTVRTSAGSKNWHLFSSSSDGTKLVAAENSPGFVHTSIDSGVTWVAQSSGGARYRQGLDSTPDGSKIVIGPSYGYVFTGSYGP